MKLIPAFTIKAMLLSAQLFGQAEPRAMISTFGRYGADCSSGRGVCSFSVDQVADSKIAVHTVQKISENTFRLTIRRHSVGPEEEQRIAGKLFENTSSKDVFLQQENLKMSLQVLQALSIDPKYDTIAAGTFPMVIGKEEAEITFTLTAAQ